MANHHPLRIAKVARLEIGRGAGGRSAIDGLLPERFAITRS